MNWRSHLRLAITLVLLAAAGTCEVMRERRPTMLRPGVHLYAYVANGGDGTVSVVDLVSLAPVETIAVGPGPASVLARPKTKEIWGVSAGGGYAWVIDAPTGRVDRIPVCGDPVSLVFSPDGKRVYVACAAGGVVAIDCATRQMVAREHPAPHGGTSAVAAAPNGKWVLAAATGAGCLIGLQAKISDPVLATLMGFIAGGVIVNSMVMELPKEKEGRFWAFCVGSFLYSLLLLLA